MTQFGTRACGQVWEHVSPQKLEKKVDLISSKNSLVGRFHAAERQDVTLKCPLSRPNYPILFIKASSVAVMKTKRSHLECVRACARCVGMGKQKRW